jgi:hypothetical protein
MDVTDVNDIELIEEEEEGQERCICWHNIKHDDIKTVRFGCGHIYHTSCIMNWLAQGNDRCPSCTSRIVDKTEFQYHGYPFIEAIKGLIDAIFKPIENVAIAFIEIIEGPLNVASKYDKYVFCLFVLWWSMQTALFWSFSDLRVVSLGECKIVYYQQKDGNLTQFDDWTALTITTLFESSRLVSLFYLVVMDIIRKFYYTIIFTYEFYAAIYHDLFVPIIDSFIQFLVRNC